MIDRPNLVDRTTIVTNALVAFYKAMHSGSLPLDVVHRCIDASERTGVEKGFGAVEGHGLVPLPRQRVQFFFIAIHGLLSLLIPLRRRKHHLHHNQTLHPLRPFRIEPDGARYR